MPGGSFTKRKLRRRLARPDKSISSADSHPRNLRSLEVGRKLGRRLYRLAGKTV